MVAEGAWGRNPWIELVNGPSGFRPPPEGRDLCEEQFPTSFNGIMLSHYPKLT